ncbi:hypothetical protein HG531_009954 [Fusarium graminearum]|nr:hypothetical protein HG531_009954 [Fusarium graminearum]
MHVGGLSLGLIPHERAVPLIERRGGDSSVSHPVIALSSYNITAKDLKRFVKSYSFNKVLASATKVIRCFGVASKNADLLRTDDNEGITNAFLETMDLAVVPVATVVLDKVPQSKRQNLAKQGFQPAGTE